MKLWAIFGVMLAFTTPAFAEMTESDARADLVNYTFEKRVAREEAPPARRTQRLSDTDDANQAPSRRDAERSQPPRATEEAQAPRISPRGRRNGAPSRVPDSMLLDPRGAL